MTTATQATPAAAAAQPLPVTPSFRVDGQRALVTGASRGIGFAAAAALAHAGAEVTLVARSDAELQAACARICSAGGACHALVLDVTDSSAVTQQLSARGPFHILVNNAGMNRPKPLVELADEDIDAVLNLNVKAAFHVTRWWRRACWLLACRAPSSMCRLKWGMWAARAAACTAPASTPWKA